MPPTRPTDASGRLDELYREHPDGFVAGRNGLARDLRADGDRERADEVAKLRKPSVAAWLINHAALTSAAEVEAFADASRELERAQRAAIDGDEGGPDALRAAAIRERKAGEAVLSAAESGARSAGHPPSDRVLELVGETLRAAAGDAELRDRVVRGRVERQQSAATLGGLGAASGTPRGRRRPGSEKHREVERARRELKRLETELARQSDRSQRLRSRVEEATEALRAEREKLAESERATAELERRVEEARGRADRA